MSITLGIISDIWIHREGLRLLCARIPDLRILGVSDTAQVRKILAMEPDLLLIDAAGGSDTFSASSILGADVRLRILALGVEDGPEESLCWLQAGVAGYVGRTADLRQVANAIRQVHQGTFHHPDCVTQALIRQVIALSKDGSKASPETLTRQEAAISDLIGRGLSNKEISERLHLAEATVKNHVHNVFQKTGFHSRTEIAAHFSHPVDLMESLSDGTPNNGDKRLTAGSSPKGIDRSRSKGLVRKISSN